MGMLLVPNPLFANPFVGVVDPDWLASKLSLPRAWQMLADRLKRPTPAERKSAARGEPDAETTITNVSGYFKEKVVDSYEYV